MDTQDQLAAPAAIRAKAGQRVLQALQVQRIRNLQHQFCRADIGDGAFQRRHGPRQHLHLVALRLDLHLHDHVLTRLQMFAAGFQHAREDHRLVKPGRVRGADEGEAVALRRFLLLPRGHGAGDIGHQRARGRSGLDLSQRRDLDPAQGRQIIVDGMARQIEADGLMFLPQPLRWQPDLRQNRARRRQILAPPEQRGLVRGRLIVARPGKGDQPVE